MKVVALIMAATALAIGIGGAQQFRYFGPETKQFWAGVLAVPASIFFALAGVLLWRRGRAARQMVLMAGLFMASATVAATALDVMGRLATLIGIGGSLVAIGWWTAAGIRQKANSI